MRMRGLCVAFGLVAACGDGLAPPDAVPPIDGPAGRVTVRYAGGNDAPTVQVLFQNADSSLVLATRTGPDGTANAFMAPGGYVTAIATNSFQYNLFTWADVQPGDELVLGGSSFSPPPKEATWVSIYAPSDPGQDIFNVYTACGSDVLSNPGAISAIQLPGGCGGDTDLLIVSRDFAFANEHYLYAPDAFLHSTHVELTGPWLPFETARIEIAGMPARTQQENAAMELLDGTSPISPSGRGATFALTGGAGSVELAMPLPAAGRALVQVTPSFQQGVIGALRAVHWGPVQATTRFDVSQNPLRGYREFPTYLRNEHAIRWSENGPGAAPDAVLAQFSFRGSDFMDKHWTILAPGNDAAIVQYPRLPLAALMPASEDDVFQPSTLTTFRLDGGGYARVKKTLPVDWGSGSPWPMDAEAGTVVIQELGSPVLFPE